jgi:hypothetical protein
MKKISTLLLSSLFTLSLLANDGGGLSIFTANTSMNLKVEIDGCRVLMQGNRVILSNLSQGYHNVRVYRELKSIAAGYNFSKSDQIIYSTSVYVSSNYQSEVIITRSGRGHVDSYRINSDDCITADCIAAAKCSN